MTVQSASDGRTKDVMAHELEIGLLAGAVSLVVATAGAYVTVWSVNRQRTVALRQPAHNTGAFALKPSFGIVPGRGHIPGPPGALSTPDMGVIGPLGRSADDLDLALDVPH
jgi:hypothetical protein